jgi:hypothetical protein
VLRARIVLAAAQGGENKQMAAVPLSRISVADVREEAIACGLVEQLSVSIVWRWLDEDALKPWRHRSWIFPRAADFAAKAGVVLDLYQRRFAGERLGPDEFVISADDEDLGPGPLPPPPDPAASLRHGHAGRARVRARRSVARSSR